ncbi:hypothetical protein K492DRAFT_198820 [Lichtheimia hyalospora FSU 10163]|nr:hypothetical protein K492DRAFT_198820 [Lichtheimia hyalospora FSU 10163]
MKQNDPSFSIVYKRFSLLPCVGSFRLGRSSATTVTTATDTDAIKRNHPSRGIKGNLKRIFNRNQQPIMKKPMTTTSVTATTTKKNDTPSMTSPISIASRTLHTTTTPAPPTTTTYDDDIRFDSDDKGDPELYFMYNTFGPLDELEETTHGNGASNDNNICKGDIQDPSLKTKTAVDYETNLNANSISTIVETNQQQQQTNPPHEPEQEQPKEDASTPNNVSSSYNAKESAQHIWEEDGVIVAKEHAAEWLGGRPFINQDALNFYMDKFDFGNMRLDEAIRKLCSKLYLKAETQQIDRILHVFANRYWRCNQDCVLQSADIVYAVAYSLVLLNTDLHVAQGNYTRMTRHEFVRNTMVAILDHQHAPLSPIRESQIQSYLKQIYVSVKQSQIMQPIQRHPSLCSTTDGEYTDNRAIRSMRSLGSIIRSARREPTSPTKSTCLAYGGDSLSCATSCLSQTATSSTPASPSQSTFSINKVMSEQISFSNDPPYIKEGLVRRKHLFESSDRKAKNREWRRCLLIVSQGQLKIYQWRQASSGDIGYKGIHRENSVNSTAAIPRSSANDEKGWDTCFRLLGCFPLNHTLTHVLPSPGYDRRRAHVFAVQFPDGGVYLFQTSNRIQCREWAATCNYWAARKSKQPLAGGVCNIEYGWGACLDEDEVNDDPDSILLCEWHPPASPLISSTFDEQDQHMTMKQHLSVLSQELDTHNQVKSKMLRKFPSRYANHAKAMHNWEVKSRYLLQDIIKYQSYCTALEKGIQKQHESLAAT